MKLGICYMVFDGEELLEYAVKSIRNVVDYISVTYQKVSYFGNSTDPNLLPLLQDLKNRNLIDDILFYETDLSIHHKINELNLRNLGREASKKAGCTHHISSDVDEMYLPNELEYVKKYMFENPNCDFCMCPYNVYYKDPTYLVFPSQELKITLIAPVDNEYENSVNFPFAIETTRKFKNFNKYKVFSANEIIIHHFSYVRKDLRKKFSNSDNAQFYKLEKFYQNYDKYKLGDNLNIIPDYINRITIQTDNIFNINF